MSFRRPTPAHDKRPAQALRCFALGALLGLAGCCTVSVLTLWSAA